VNRSCEPKARQSNLLLLSPLGYRDMLALQMNALFVITDSGGVQVETTVLGIPCLTVMDHPVWLITHKEGTNVLVGSDCSKLGHEADKILKSKPKSKSKSLVPLWDGQTAERIIAIISTQ
jgi:UDP-N-acetylglucosamine 2-epimerase (non-hydrolysing)